MRNMVGMVQALLMMKMLDLIMMKMLNMTQQKKKNLVVL